MVGPHHIVAIGASAGGMEEINSFFDNTSSDGVSYIIIQHLSMDFKSRMVEVLTKHTSLLVEEAENGTSVKNNRVYLIPSDKFMVIRDNKLYLAEKTKTHSPHLTINKFFNSLAIDCGKKAIGIIFSGLGFDGTDGIKAIKKNGGMVIARNPETTTFKNMPVSAIATGLVDFILEPELMPQAIEDYIKYGTDTVDDEKNILAIIDLIKEKSPLDFSDYKQATIIRRTKRRAAYSNFTRLGNYLNFLKTTPQEVEALSRDFLISVTSFFRDKEAFDFIQESILPSIFKGLVPGEEFKIWVAGCATGEEAYSIAILIYEQLTGKFKDIVVKIFATDINNGALMHASKGIYNSKSVRNVSAERLEKHFSKEGNNYRIKPAIRKMIIFAQHDLVKNPPYCNMHFISCRNLLIYMTPVLQKKIFAMFLFGLKMNGYLFLGASENPISIVRNLEVVNKKWKIYKNLETKRALRFDTFSMPELLETKRSSNTFQPDSSSKNLNNALSEEINEALVNQLNCLVICVNENNHVVKYYGDTTKYLLQQNFNSNLEQLLPKPLAVAFNTLCAKALKTGKKGIINGIKIERGNFIVKINLSVIPLTVKKGGQKLFMVMLAADKQQDDSAQEESVFEERTYLDQYTLNLEEEVKELKDKLQSVYEQLDASSENLQSFNEEMVTANEEMQSTNEEMQSVNEELDTLNADYQLKNKELLEINDDLNNYFRSNINGQLFVNNDLVLMKFSPGTVKQINLLESDIGRPLSCISTNIKFEAVIDDVKQVLTEGTIVTREIETNDGKWYQVMTMPYIQQADKKRTGAIITFNNITELKSTQMELDKRNKSLTLINADLDNFVHTASHDLLAPLSNIEGSIEVMNMIEVSDPDLNKFLSIINSSVKKFRSLIKDIATIGKLEGDMLAMEMVDLNEIINNIIWSLENKIKLSGAVINRDLDVKYILFSKKNLRSIIYNLISNGIKFRGDRPPVIDIYTKKLGDHVVLTIQDNGIGIPAGGREKIFDMYGRLHTDVEGQGIGLYLAKKIINAAGGNITIESEPGHGSKFTIFFKGELERSNAAASQLGIETTVGKPDGTMQA